jgi:hypothetical protein
MVYGGGGATAPPRFDLRISGLDAPGVGGLARAHCVQPATRIG